MRIHFGRNSRGGLLRDALFAQGVFPGSCRGDTEFRFVFVREKVRRREPGLQSNLIKTVLGGPQKLVDGGEPCVEYLVANRLSIGCEEPGPKQARGHLEMFRHVTCRYSLCGVRCKIDKHFLD